MSDRTNYVLAGLSAAAVTVLSVGGYLLHRKVLKHRLQEQAKRQAMQFAMIDLQNEKDANDFFYDHNEFYYGNNNNYDDDEDCGAYPTDFMGELNKEDNSR